MLSFGVFGITNDSLNQAVSVLILVLIVIWAALVFWTYADARRRIDGIVRRRQHAREMRHVMEMPDHLLKDIGFVAWGGKLWPISGGRGARR